MHPSRAIFARIQSLWPENIFTITPVFFSLSDGGWQQIPAADLETFYCHIRDKGPKATTIVTAYKVGEKPMLVAHYESVSETCHRVWSVEEGQILRTIYDAPVEHIMRRHAAAA